MKEYSDKTNISIAQNNCKEINTPREFQEKIFNNSEYGYINVYKKAIEKFGKQLQSVVAMEEMAELIKEISKSLRGKHSQDAITEEIADVEIMLEQLKLIFDCHDIIKTVKKQKIERLEGLVENGSNG